MVDDTVIYSSIQNIAYTGIQGSTEAGSILTLGPGKYEMIAEFTLESYGAANQVRIQLDTDIMLRWFGGAAGDDVPGQKKSFTTYLEESANTVLNMTQNSGDNGELDYNVNYRSTPNLELRTSAAIEEAREKQLEWWNWASHEAKQLLKQDIIPGHYSYGNSLDYHLTLWQAEEADLYYKYLRLLKTQRRRNERREIKKLLKKAKSQ